MPFQATSCTTMPGVIRSACVRYVAVCTAATTR